MPQTGICRRFKKRMSEAKCFILVLRINATPGLHCKSLGDCKLHAALAAWFILKTTIDYHRFSNIRANGNDSSIAKIEFDLVSCGNGCVAVLLLTVLFVM